MTTLETILALLDRWPLWKKVTEAPARLDQLEKRITELEEKLKKARGRPAEACPGCGEPKYRLKSSQPNKHFGQMGKVDRTYECEACGFSETRTLNP
jgi:hypothetical protein